jgi:O-methyltransferase
MNYEDSEYLDLLKKCLTASLYDESGWQVIPGERRPEQKSLRHPVRYARAWVRHLLVRTLARRQLLLVKKARFDAAARAEGRDWPCFGYTMVGHRRLDNVQECIERVIRDGVPGDVLEAGAWRGGVAILMRAVLRALGVTDRTVWVADSFAGLPKPTWTEDQTTADLSEVDYMKVSLEQVQANFERFGLLDGQVRFLKGWFKDTLPSAPVEKLAVLRLDADMYSSTMDVLRALYPKVSDGGYVIVDDYHTWDSCRRAVDDFCREHGINNQAKQIDYASIYWQVKR